MWDLFGHIGLILGIIVSIGSIFGYFAKVLPSFKSFQVKNGKSNSPNTQSSSTNITQSSANYA